MAGRGFLVIVEVVIPNEFFTGGNVAERKNPDAAFDLIHLAVWIAGVIEIRAEAFTVDDGFAILQAIQVSARRTIIETVGFFGRDARSGVFHDAGALSDGRRREHAHSMNGGWTNYQRHTTNFARLRNFGKWQKYGDKWMPSKCYGS